MDFAAAADQTAIAVFDKTSTPGLYTASILSAGLTSINRMGQTQFRLYFTKDDNDDGLADYISFYNGRYATGSMRPTLVITYYVP